jgi:hypothetical protein
MKNLRLLAILIVGALLFQSCNNDEEGASANKADLIGVWTTSEIDLNVLVDGESIENDSITSIFEAGQETIEFKDDDTFVTNDGTIDVSTGTWSLNSDGNVILFEPEDSEPFEYEIVSVASNQLKIKFEEDLTALAEFFEIEIEDELILVGNVTFTK